MDGLVQRIQEQVPPLEQWRKFIYCESMTGRAYGEVDHFEGEGAGAAPPGWPACVAWSAPRWPVSRPARPGELDGRLAGWGSAAFPGLVQAQALQLGCPPAP
jgi:hypothetical protein